MTREAAINTAKAQGYGVQYSRNPKGYAVIYTYSDGTSNEEFFASTFEQAMNRMEEIGYELAERLMDI